LTKDEALKLALEALEEAHYKVEHKQDAAKREQAITAIKEALAQPAQQPDELTIAYMSGLYDGKKAEREACAKVVEIEAMQYAEPVWAFEIVNDIRARGNT